MMVNSWSEHLTLDRAVQLLVLTGYIAVVFYRPNTLLAQYLSPLRFATLGVIVGVTLS